MASPPRPGRLGRQRRALRRRDHGLPEARDRAASTRRRRVVELREHVVEQQQRRESAAARPRRGAARGARGAARPGSRSSRRSRLPAAIENVVAVRADARSPRARCRSRAAPRALGGRRLAVVARARRRRGRARDVRSAKPGRERGEHLPPEPPRAPPERGDALGPRRERVARREPSCTRRSAAFRCASAAAYSCGSPARAGKRRPSTRSKYARRAAGPALDHASRSGVKTSVGNSRRSASLEASRAPSSSAAFAVARRRASTRTSCATPPRSSSSATSAAALAEADQLGVRARARREPLRAEMERLEQVRLAGAVLAHDEHDPGREREVERGVGAVSPGA